MHVTVIINGHKNELYSMVNKILSELRLLSILLTMLYNVQNKKQFELCHVFSTMLVKI